MGAHQAVQQCGRGRQPAEVDAAPVRAEPSLELRQRGPLPRVCGRLDERHVEQRHRAGAACRGPLRGL
eukprot:8901442-Lingulodinium_polyedra.AAC.1